MPSKRRALLAAAWFLATLAAPASAQSHSDKPITFLVPFAAGSATDQLARVIGQAVSAETRQPVVVDNRPGASGFIATQAAAKAAPDGLTVLISTNTTHAANEHLYKKLPYDPVKDFEPVSLLGTGGQIMVVGAASPYRSVADVLAAARQAPSKLSFASGSASSRMAGELLQQMAGVQLLHVPYKSNPPALTDVIGGQVTMMITDMATGLPQVKAGKVRALGVSTPRRSPLVPEVPTIAEAGVPGYEMGYWFAAYVPAGTPAPVVRQLNGLLGRAVHGPGARPFYESTGTEPVSSSPQELATFQAAESRKWGRIVKAARIEPE